MSAADTILERLAALHPKLIDLSLTRLHRALAVLGHPERHLPPVIHVAGTNGKGSTCAFLRAIAEAAGQRVHVYTSPHLVTMEERIRLAGQLVTPAVLEATLEEIERRNDGAPITVFEVLTAAALLLFSRVPADLAILEVGLGGRYDATNVVDHPAACAIASISMDHTDFLGDTLAKIAGEKAGIMKPGVPCATGAHPREVLAVLEQEAATKGCALLARGLDWQVEQTEKGIRFRDADGVLNLPAPALPGPWQAENAGIAIAALRAWNPPWLNERAIAEGLRRVEWPARMQRLHGTLAQLLPPGWELWLDGGHNEGAGRALAAQLQLWQAEDSTRPIHLVVGMKQSKAVESFWGSLLPYAASAYAVAEPGQHLAMPVADVMAASGGRAVPGPDIRGALAALCNAASPDAPAPRVLICGSLYLAGEVLKADAA